MRDKLPKRPSGFLSLKLFVSHPHHMECYISWQLLPNSGVLVEIIPRPFIFQIPESLNCQEHFPQQGHVLTSIPVKSSATRLLPWFQGPSVLCIYLGVESFLPDRWQVNKYWNLLYHLFPCTTSRTNCVFPEAEAKMRLDTQEVSWGNNTLRISSKGSEPD